MIRQVRHVIILLACVAFASLFEAEHLRTTADQTQAHTTGNFSSSSSNNNHDQPMALSCLEPNLHSSPLNDGTLRVLERQRQGLLPKPLPYPIFNVGLPKMGSNTLMQFFTCAGLRANHGQNGQCFAQAQQQGVPLLTTCTPLKYRSDQTPKNNNNNATSSSPVQAWLQLDVTFPPDACYYPQMSMLEELHREAPNATFVLNFRPVRDWWRSLRHWHKMQRRLQDCDLPGLPKGQGRAMDELQDWWCRHVQNVRQFVRQHPSHTLVELDLYNTQQSSTILAELFHTNASCWGHANANTELVVGKEQEKEEEATTKMIMEKMDAEQRL
ncbi:hypothetical protein ACA910_005417 [Epithemia clementina (nom. ined.)]